MLSPGFYNFEPIRQGSGQILLQLDTPSGEFYRVILDSNGSFEVLPQGQTAKQMMSNELMSQIKNQLSEFYRGAIGLGDLSFVVSY